MKILDLDKNQRYVIIPYSYSEIPIYIDSDSTVKLIDRYYKFPKDEDKFIAMIEKYKNYKYRLNIFLVFESKNLAIEETIIKIIENIFSEETLNIAHLHIITNTIMVEKALDIPAPVFKMGIG